MRHILATLIFVIGIHSITNAQSNITKHINLKKSTESLELQELNKYIKSVRIVPLETKKNGLIDPRSVSKIYASDDRIVIFNSGKVKNQITVFDNNGKWIASSSYGSGNGKTPRVYDIAFDHKNDGIVAVLEKEVIFLDKNLSLVRSVPRSLMSGQIALLGDEIIHYFTNAQKQDYRVVVTDRNMNVKKRKYATSNELDIMSETMMFEHSGGLSLCRPFCDTIFLYNGKDFAPRYVVDYDNKCRVPAKAKEWSNFIMSPNGYNISNYVENDKHQYFSITNDTESKYIVAYRNKSNGHVANYIIQNFKSKSAFHYAYNSYKSQFIGILNYYSVDKCIESLREFINDQEYNKLKAMKENDNPVVIFYELKNF